MGFGGDDEGTKVVVAFLDKRRERGVVKRFRASEPDFDLYPPTGGAPRNVKVAECKAIYFVKTLEGNRAFKENKTQLPPVYRQGQKIEVTYTDGERTVGTTEGFNPTRQGFVMFPADPKSNNIEVFVVTGNAEEILLPGADVGGKDKVFHPRGEKGLFDPPRRLEAVLRVLKGETLEAVAKELSVPRDTLAQWKEAYQRHGPSGLGVAPNAPPAPGGGLPPGIRW